MRFCVFYFLPAALTFHSSWGHEAFAACFSVLGSKMSHRDNVALFGTDKAQVETNLPMKQLIVAF